MIETRGLRHRFPGGPGLVFDDVDVPQAGVLVLRGPSGAGKSTWLALAAGLLAVQQGAMRVAAQPLAGMRRAALDAWRAQTLGFLPQKLHLSESLTVEGNLGLVYYAAGLPVDRTVIREALARLGVAGLAGRRPSQLSGGQAQRVALARSVLRRPRVILADEPTASLDDEAASAALLLLCDCAAESRATLVIATHDARVPAALPAAQVLRLHAASERAVSAAPAA